MQGSRGGDLGFGALQVLTLLSEAASRLALPAALLGLASGGPDLAFSASLVALVASVVRGYAGSRAVERAMIDAWARLIAASRARAASRLPRRREAEESIAALIEGAYDEARHRALLVPQGAGIAIAFVGLAVASVILLGWGRAAILGGILCGLAACSAWLARDVRRYGKGTWSAFGVVSLEMRVLVEAALELRATGREGHVGDRVAIAVAALADQQRRATAAGLRIGVLPASLGLVLVCAPLRAGLRPVEAWFAGTRLFEASILGVAAVGVAIAAARSWEAWALGESRRARFTEFTRRSADERPSTQITASLATCAIRVEGFGYAWSEDGVETPRGLEAEIGTGGTALVGPNGAGKTTLLLAVLGLLRPTSGRIRVDGVDAHHVSTTGRVGYVSQDPFVAPGESIRWHLRLHDDASDERVDEALHRVGLANVLVPRARARETSMRDLPAGELSGGERRWMAVARAIQLPRELYVFDEPEAGVDNEGRARLRQILEELSRHARVLVVAHDTSVVPETFGRLAVGHGCDASASVADGADVPRS